MSQLAFLRRFELGEIEEEYVLSGGMFSRPLLLKCERGKFVLRTHNFRTKPTSFRFQAESLAAVAELGIRCAAVLATSDGSWCETLPDGRGVLALHEYVEGRMHDWYSWYQLKESDPGFLVRLGQTVAQLHNALAEAHPSGDAHLSCDLPPIQFRHLDAIYGKWMASMQQLQNFRLKRENRAASRFIEYQQEINRHWVRVRESLTKMKYHTIPTQIVHGDLSPVNLVFSERGEVTFIDWDCVHIGHRMYDALGDVLNRPPVEHPELNVFRADHVADYLSGYAAEICQPLSQQELELVPTFCLARQLEDLRQRMHVVLNLAPDDGKRYGQLIQLRVEMMDQIELN